MEGTGVHELSVRSNESRKVLRRSLSMDIKNALKLRGRTLDVSRTGLTVMSPWQFQRGMVCEIEFDISLDGEIKKVCALSKTGDCVCVGTEGFRTNLRFLRIDELSRQVINDWLNYPAKC